MGYRLGLTMQAESRAATQWGCICDFHLAMACDQLGIEWPFPWPHPHQQVDPDLP